MHQVSNWLRARLIWNTTYVCSVWFDNFILTIHPTSKLYSSFISHELLFWLTVLCSLLIYILLVYSYSFTFTQTFMTTSCLSAATFQALTSIKYSLPNPTSMWVGEFNIFGKFLFCFLVAPQIIKCVTPLWKILNKQIFEMHTKFCISNIWT